MKLPIFVACLTICLAAPSRAQKLEVTPPLVRTDETVTIRATGLAAAEHIVIRAELVDGAGENWKAEAGFLADKEGVVDLSQQAPESGSYRTVSAMGLIWAMLPLSQDAHVYRWPNDFTPQKIHFSVLRENKVAAEAELVQKLLADGVRQVSVEGALHGVLFLPPGEGKHPGILVVGGSEGGAPLRRAAQLASHGYAALALAYFHYTELPPSAGNVPLEYFGSALEWMMQRPEIDSQRLGIVGASIGGELALQLASIYPQLRAVVAYVPSNVRFAVFAGSGLAAPWTWQGHPLPYVRPGQLNDARASFPATIQVERIQGAVLVIGGESDEVWPSGEMVDRIASRLHQAHFAFPFVKLKYPHAGHRAGMPEIVPSWTKETIHPVTGRPMNYGGTPEGNAESTADAIPKVFGFLHDNLDNVAVK